MKLGYVIEFVSDMNRAVKFYRDVPAIRLESESPEQCPQCGLASS